MDDYYMEQAGSGIGAYAGVRYQKGDGFFGRLISGSVLPIIKKVMPFLGKTALSSGLDVMNDWSDGAKLSDSLKKRGSEALNKIKTSAMKKMNEMNGNGKRKRASVDDHFPVNDDDDNDYDSPEKSCTLKKAKRASRPIKKKKKAIDFL